MGLHWPAATRHSQLEDPRASLLLQSGAVPLPPPVPIPYTVVAQSIGQVVGERMDIPFQHPDASIALTVQFDASVMICPPGKSHKDMEDIIWRGSETALLALHQPRRWYHVVVRDAHYLTAELWKRLARVIAGQRVRHHVAPTDGSLTLYICPAFEYASGWRIGRDLLNVTTDTITDLEGEHYDQTALATLVARAGERFRTTTITEATHQSRLLSSFARLGQVIPKDECKLHTQGWADKDGPVCDTLDRCYHWNSYKPGKAMGMKDKGWTELAPSVLGQTLRAADYGEHVVSKLTLQHMARDELWALAHLPLWHPAIVVKLEGPPGTTPLEILGDCLARVKRQVTHHWGRRD